jgi:hypothetical protein
MVSQEHSEGVRSMIVQSAAQEHRVQDAQAYTYPARWSHVALIAGGSLMVTMYALEMVYGLQTGRMFRIPDLPSSGLAQGSAAAFTLGLLLIAVGQLDIAAVLRRVAPRLALASALLGCVPIIGAPINLTLLAGVMGQPTIIGTINGLGVITNLASATLLGIVALRRKALPRAAGMTLLAVGLGTFPLILLTIPLETLITPWVAEDFPFPMWGLIFIVLGVILQRNRAQRGA